MTTQTDVKASQRTSTGAFVDESSNAIGRCRVKGFTVTGAGTLTLSNGNGGTNLIVTATSAGTLYVLIPGEGVLFPTSVYGTLTGATACTIFYGQNTSLAA